jgi:hypothetical protein
MGQVVEIGFLLPNSTTWDVEFAKLMAIKKSKIFPLTPLNATYVGQKQRVGFIKAWIIDNFSSPPKLEVFRKRKDSYFNSYIMLPAAAISFFL